MLFSVVIPTYNRPEALRRCLLSLQVQHFPAGEAEVLVVDDGGSYPMEELLLECAGPLPVRRLRQENAGPGAARNAGAQAARGRYLIFVDDDCLCDPNFLTDYRIGLEGHPQALLGGRVCTRPQENLYCQTAQIVLDMALRFFNSDPGRASFFSSNNFAVGRCDFLELGGFWGERFRVASEDREFCDRWRLRGLPLLALAGASVYHAPKLNLAGFVRMYFRYGRGAYRYHQIRHQRRSGSLRADSRFHLLLPYLLVRALRRFSSLERIRIVFLLALWQLANLCGFLYEWASAEPSAPVPGGWKFHERVVEHGLTAMRALELLSQRMIPQSLANEAGREPESFLRVLFQRIGPGSRRFLEFGHAFLASELVATEGWSGYHFSRDEFGLQRAQRVYQGRPVDCQLESFPAEEIELLIVCLLDDEYAVWERLAKLTPRVVCVLYNASYLPWQEFRADRGAASAWSGDRNFSASLRSLNGLAQTLGYRLVGCTGEGEYAFFVRADLLGQHFAWPGSLLLHYRCPKYCYGSFGYPRHSRPGSNFQHYLQSTGSPPTLRAGSWDLAIWNSVVEEYAVLPAAFSPDDVVLDLGAHVGGFSAAASMRGGPKVLAFEANSQNYRLARKNLGPFPSCRLENVAVWRSDVREQTLAFTSSLRSVNTGGGTVVASAAPEHTEATAYLVGESVNTVALDTILEPYPQVRYLKIDVEGAEYPILLTSRLLGRVFEIAGEFHQSGESETMAALAAHLRALGFWVIWRDTSPGLGLFFASREEDLRERERKTLAFGPVHYHA
jgi:FkbM family methyltransferase